MEDCRDTDDILHYLKVMPGKSLQGVAAQFAGIGLDSYCNLIVEALRGSNPNLGTLADALSTALAPYLPARTMPLSE